MKHTRHPWQHTNATCDQAPGTRCSMQLSIRRLHTLNLGSSFSGLVQGTLLGLHVHQPRRRLPIRQAVMDMHMRQVPHRHNHLSLNHHHRCTGKSPHGQHQNLKLCHVMRSRLASYNRNTHTHHPDCRNHQPHTVPIDNDHTFQTHTTLADQSRHSRT